MSMVYRAIPVLNDIAKKHNQSIAYVRTRDDDSELIYTPDQKKELISYASTYMNQDDEENIKFMYHLC